MIYLNLKTKKFLNIYGIHIFHSFAHLFVFGLLFLYLHQIGFTNLEIALFSTLEYFGAFLVLFFLKTVDFKKIITAATILKSILLLMFVNFIRGFETIQLYLIALSLGVVIFTFWVPFNIKYFGLGNNKNNAFMGSILFMLWPLMNMFLPGIAGYAVNSYGFKFLFIVSAAINLLAIFCIKWSDNGLVLKFNLKNALENTKGVKTLMSLEGLFQGILWTAIPLATISYFGNAIDYGLFFSYLGLFGAIASVFLSRLSDNMKNRTSFIYPVALLLGLSAILTGFATTLIVWAIANAFLVFFATVFGPFQTAVVLDKSKNLVDSMASREFFLNFGRTGGGVIAIFSLLLFEKSEYSLLVAGLSVFVYALVIRKKKLYI